MKIGIFLQDLSGGGAEKIMIGFANYLVNNTKDEVYLILVRKEGPYLRAVSEKIKIINLNKNKTLYSFMALYSAMKEYKIEMLYSTLVNTNILALIVSKILGIKLIIREANTIKLLREKEHRVFIKIANFLSNYLYNLCYKCIAVSNVVKDDLVKYTNCSEQKIHVIYNPIIIQDSVNVEINKSFFHVGMVSRLTVQKNIPTICKVIELLLIKGLDIQFHFFGTGDSSEIEKLQDKYNAHDRIILHGFQHSYYSYIKQMDVFIHLPLWEGLGNSVLEVFNSGIPMILSNVRSGYAELINKGDANVHFIDPYDVHKVVDIIEDYIAHTKEIKITRRNLNLNPNAVYKSYRELAV